MSEKWHLFLFKMTSGDIVERLAWTPSQARNHEPQGKMARPPRLFFFSKLNALRVALFYCAMALFFLATTSSSSSSSSSSSTSSSSSSSSSPPSCSPTSLPHSNLLQTADAWGPVSTPVPAEAIASFNEAVRSYAGLRGEILAPLNHALSVSYSPSSCACSSYLMAHIFRAHILLLSTGVQSSHPLVQESYKAAAECFSPSVSTVLHPGYCQGGGDERNDRNVSECTPGDRSISATPTMRERLYFLALHALYDPCTPDYTLAARYWEEVLWRNPRDLLAVRSAHDAYIILGDTEGMKASLARVLSRWDAGEEAEKEGGKGWEGGVEVGEKEEDGRDDARKRLERKTGSGSEVEGEEDRDLRKVRSMWAFALEEAGDLHRSAEVARSVLEEDPMDDIALHALIHTYEMVAARREGREAFREEVMPPSLFAHHIAWHRAVMALGWEEGGMEEGWETVVWRVLDDVLLMDEGRRAPATPLAMADASSLLWRMMLVSEGGGEDGEGEDRVMKRLHALRKWYQEGGYEDMHSTSFNDVHMLMCLARVDLTAAHRALASMRRLAASAGEGRALSRRGRGCSQRLHRQLRNWLVCQFVRLPLPPPLSSWLQRGWCAEDECDGRKSFSVTASSDSPSSLPTPQSTNAKVLATVGLDVGAALVKFVEGDYAETVRLLSASAAHWHLVGGSHAQRDVLALTLITACLRNGTDLARARRLLAERAMEKDPENEEGTWTLLRQLEGQGRREGGDWEKKGGWEERAYIRHLDTAEI